MIYKLFTPRYNFFLFNTMVFVFFCFFLYSSVNVSAADAKRFFLEITPFEEAKDALVFINDGAPEKFIMQKQRFLLKKTGEYDFIKIDVVLRNSSAFKNEIIYASENSQDISFTLKKKFPEELKIFGRAISDFISGAAKYMETNDEKYKKIANKGLVVFTDMDLMEKIYGSFKLIDKFDYLDFIYEINRNLYIPDEIYLNTIKPTINMIPKVNDIIGDIKKIRAYGKDKALKSVITDKIFWKSLELLPDLSRVYENIREGMKKNK